MRRRFLGKGYLCALGAFKLREFLASHAELARKLEEMEKKYHSQFRGVFKAIRQLMAPPAAGKKKIGFQLREKCAPYGRR
jgi:hypothetical protein